MYITVSCIWGLAKDAAGHHVVLIWVAGAPKCDFLKILALKWYFCFLKRTINLLVCSSLPSPRVALLSLLPFSSPFLHPSSSSSLYLLFLLLHILLPWLVDFINLSYPLSSTSLFSLSASLFYISANPPS